MSILRFDSSASTEGRSASRESNISFTRLTRRDSPSTESASESSEISELFAVFSALLLLLWSPPAVSPVLAGGMEVVGATLLFFRCEKKKAEDAIGKRGKLVMQCDWD